tara:strand:+ start:19284 stop:22121 length:2838 start_codon:yes stop_codon:yes gene_type:complete
MVKKIYVFISILVGLGFFIFYFSTEKSALAVFEKLTCETLENPMGIDNSNPTFSWIVKASGYNKSQKSYQILVASSPEALCLEGADMWNSEKVNTSESVYIQYKGAALASGSQYWWKVKIWDQDGKESQWSVPQYFEMGLLQQEDWEKAQWISLGAHKRVSEHRFREYQTNKMDAPEIRTSNPTGYFRKEIRLKAPVKTARAYVCGLGYYEMYLNGEKVGDHLLDPMPTSYDHSALYVTYDISKYLKEEDNSLGIILGNGFYGQDIAFWKELAYGKPAFKIVIHVAYEDGSIEEIVSDASWKVSTGPIVFDNVYAGETYDARCENTGWNELGFDDSKWNKAAVSEPVVGKLCSQLMPAIKKIVEIDPVNVFKGVNGNWIVDFGQNIAGWVKIVADQDHGDVIEIRTTEALNRKGDAIHAGSIAKFATGVEQLDVYICKGEGREEWEPRFTYQAFQFAEISGLNEKPSEENVKAIVVRNDMVETGSFTCSDPLLNKMVEVSKWTILDNLHGIPEDCPGREKCGWLGDAHATAQFNLYSFDMTLFFRKYARDIESQLLLKPGEYTDQDKIFRVPTQVAPGKRGANEAWLDWGIAEVYVPWYVYLNTGDREGLDTHFDEMKDLVGFYLSFKNDKGVIENGGGDWCPPLWDRHTNPGAMECHPYISANAYFYDILGIMSRVAKMMGEDTYAKELLTEQHTLKETFNREFLVNIGEDAKWYGSQTATVMALQFGMVPEELKEAVVEGLKYDIINIKKGHHATGIHGNRYIYSVLNDLGEKELAYKLLTTPEFPSQAYILNTGLNTWPERQWKWDSGIEWDRSLNHPMQAGFTALFYESLAGIKPIPEFPGYKKFIVKPTLWKQLDHAGAEIQSPYGSILSKWRRIDSGATLELKVPFNTEAIVILPLKDGTTPEIQRENGTTIPVKNFDKESGIILGSGSYTLLFEHDDL